MKSTHKAAIVIALAVSLWVLSSLIIPPDDGTAGVQTSTASSLDLAQLLKIEERIAEEHGGVIRIYGQTEPLRSVQLKAETQGTVIKIPGKEGQRIKAGDIIVQIDKRDRVERLNQAKALVNQRLIENQAAQKLQKKGFQSEVRLAETKARLAEARANLKEIQLDLGFTDLRAPFDGVLDRINVEVGDFVGVGVFGVEGALGTLVDQDPLIVTGQVAEKERSGISIGSKAEVNLNTGEQVEGTVTYLASVAEASSRTFRVEVEVPNEDLKLPSGVTAELRVPSTPKPAYLISPSMLALDDQGSVGVHHLDENNMVRFTRIELLEDTDAGMWVGGLPSPIRLITAAQTYVSPGQTLESELVQQATVKGEGDVQPN